MKNKAVKLAVFLLTLVETTGLANASEYSELYRGARAQAMGNAYVGLADDEQAIFLNPAGLAGIKTYSLHYLLADFDMSSDTVLTAADGLSAFNNLSGDSLNVIMGKNIYGRAQITPTILTPNLGVAVIVDQQAAVLAKNQALPQITIGYQFTNGIQLAWATSLSRNRFRARDDFRIGVGGKVLWRRGGYKLLTLNQLLSVGTNTLGDVAGNFGLGYGVDLGVQYVRKFNKRLSASWGLVMTDIGDTAFGEIADTQKSNLSTGLAASYELRSSRVTLTYDYKHILQMGDFKKRNHIGAEFKVPMISIFGGFNQSYLTYGTSFDAWMFKLTAVSYAEEQGTLSGMEGERRYLLRLALKVGL